MDGYRNEEEEQFMAGLIQGGTFDDGGDGIPDDGGDDITASFLNESGEGAENIERGEEGTGEEEEHNGSGDGTVVITEVYKLSRRSD